MKQKLFSKDTSPTQKRSILWTLGHIASHENGFKLIQGTSLIKDIIDMAENAEILQLRGTCIYIIGMMCRTSSGRKEIQKYNWLFSKSQVASGSVSVCLPRDARRMFQVQTGDFRGSLTCNSMLLRNTRDLKVQLSLSKEEAAILDMIGNLINGVIWNQNYSDLQKEQEKNPQALMNPKLFEHVILYLSVYNRYQPKSRKFIFNLFDQLIFQNKLLKKRFINL
jgi:rapamycin-insensitive companion of mTOR